MQSRKEQAAQPGAMNNPRMNLMKEIERTAGLGVDFIDLTIEAPAATPDGHDWQVVRAAIADAGLEEWRMRRRTCRFTMPHPWCARRRSTNCAAALTWHSNSVRPFARRTSSGGRVFSTRTRATNSTGRRIPSSSSMATSAVAVTLENSPHNRHQLKYFRRSSSACQS